MLRPRLGLLQICALPVALTLCTAEAQAGPKKTGAGKTSVSPAKARPQVFPQGRPTGRPATPAANLPKNPRPTKRKKKNTASQAASASAPRPSSSLVKKAPGAARRWITPLITHSNKLRPGDYLDYDYRIESMIHVINPDTEASLRLRLTCYDHEGNRAGNPVDKTIAPMASAVLAPPRDKTVWCHLTTSIPSIAYLSLYHFRRHIGNTPDIVTEQKVVPLFKAQG